MTLNIIETYANWTVSAWNSKSGKEVTSRDHSVMGMGLSGEAAEVVDVLLPCFENGSEVPLLNLTKELGDTAYYWARICRAFDVPLRDVWPTASPQDRGPSSEVLVMRMVRHTGRVTEHIKKAVRDGAYGREALVRDLAAAAEAWRAVCTDHGLSVEAVLAANQQKVEDRVRRGVMAGSGDDR